MSALSLASSLHSRALFPAAAWRQTSAQADANGRQEGKTSASGGKADLSQSEQQEVAALQKTDRRVRQHEQMHMAAGAGLVVSGPTYSFETGPDGRRYAVAGEVSIDTSKGRTPEETLDKARTIRAAALAPPDPSAQDRRAAAMADRLAAEASLEMQSKRAEAAAGEQSADADQPEAIQFYRSMGRSARQGQSVSAYA